MVYTPALQMIDKLVKCTGKFNNEIEFTIIFVLLTHTHTHTHRHTYMDMPKYICTQSIKGMCGVWVCVVEGRGLRKYLICVKR